MLITDFRQAIKDYSHEELVSLASELYKAMPKKLKEEKAIDYMVSNFRTAPKAGKASPKSVEIDFFNLQLDVEEFVSDAMAQYYFAPNRVISKSKRPKWRFIVKQFVKDLQTIPVDSENGEEATNLLCSLYRTMQHGCCYWIFSSDHPFSTMGIDQTVFLSMILERWFRQVVTAETMKDAILLAVSGGLDRETYHMSLLHVLVGFLTTVDRKEMAIKQVESLVADAGVKISQLTKFKNVSYQLDLDLFLKKDEIDKLSELGFLIYLALHDVQKAIAFYKKHQPEQNTEIRLYVMLYMLQRQGLVNEWMDLYEKEEANGVEPRESLVEKRHYIRENDAFPEWM